MAHHLRKVLLTGVTTGVSLPVLVADYPYISIFYSSTGTTSGGAVVFEEADFSPEDSDPIYGGTWSAIETRNASTFSGTIALAYHASPAAYAWVRVRVSSDITGGGTIKVVLRATTH